MSQRGQGRNDRVLGSEELAQSALSSWVPLPGASAVGRHGHMAKAPLPPTASPSAP